MYDLDKHDPANSQTAAIEEAVVWMTEKLAFEWKQTPLLALVVYLDTRDSEWEEAERLFAEILNASDAFKNFVEKAITCVSESRARKSVFQALE